MADAPFNFLDELPAADVRIGPGSHLRVYGFADIEPRLVQVRWGGLDRDLNLTVEQAEAIATGLLAAVAKARGGGSA